MNKKLRPVTYLRMPSVSLTSHYFKANSPIRDSLCHLGSLLRLMVQFDFFNNSGCIMHETPVSGQAVFAHFNVEA